MTSKASPQEDYALACELFGQGTPQAFTEAVARTQAAADAGFADAITQLATLDAVGAGRPRDFANAFNLLRKASGSGSKAAKSQLSLLGENMSPDLARLLEVPKPVPLAESPRIRHFPGFAPAAVCDWIVDRVRTKLAPALVWNSKSESGTADPIRSNSAVELRLTEMDVVIAVLRARISAATRLPEPIFETPQAMHYAVGQQFRLHHDYLDPAVPAHVPDLKRRGQRIATFLLYLNDDFEGGETAFPAAGISFRGAKGDALFFSNVSRNGEPDPRSMHVGCPPTSGEKWILSQWIRDRAPPAQQAS
jgi:prolyl 4-hydroxylase